MLVVSPLGQVLGQELGRQIEKDGNELTYSY